MVAPEYASMMILAILRERHMSYADAQAEYARRVGLGSAEVSAEFARLVEVLIAEKMVNYQSDVAAGGARPAIEEMWLRPWGQARIKECGPPG